ncbi:MAG: RlpA-like double-psi beta-barrel-protein domain-containing protein-containing protein [Piptocephalis tieghemiana]|nr:MAG: RlpA-like double-psi beta-barrel-protein domain-containing protein-containing protein [Piptocephalis tieghemiana]
MQTFTTAATLFTLIATGVMASPAPFGGDGTFYSPGNDACSKSGHSSTASDLIAALNVEQFGGHYNGDTDQSPSCYKCAQVKGPKGSVKVQIVDLCPECKQGDLDLSPSAFKAIADPVAGRVPISWTWTSC